MIARLQMARPFNGARFVLNWKCAGSSDGRVISEEMWVDNGDGCFVFNKVAAAYLYDIQECRNSQR